jgi:hypothetical protein
MKKAVRISKIIFGAFLVFSIFISIQPQMALADPPQDVKIAYDSNSQTLTVTITHKSSFPGFHYIKSVDIKKNGIVVSANAYDKQPDEATFAYTYKIAADKGDALEATVSCSLSGTKSATLDVGK